MICTGFGRSVIAMMTQSELQALCGRFVDVRIGVVGDFALDVYWTVDPAVAKVSVETGKRTQPVMEQRRAAGGAGNVVANLCALGCGEVAAFGVVGRDPWGDALRRELDGLGADTTGLERQTAEWSTVAYVKPHIGGVEQSRFDFGDVNRLHDETADRIVDGVARRLPELDALVINAQAESGIHSDYMQRRLAALVTDAGDRMMIVDSREVRTMYAGCLLKINDREAARYCGVAVGARDTVERDIAVKAAIALYAERGRPVFVTRGEEGMLVQDKAGMTEIPAITLAGEVDPTGAGDAALAGITAGLACGETPARAACAGALAAAVCAGKLHQTGTASPEEMAALVAKM